MSAKFLRFPTHAPVLCGCLAAAMALIPVATVASPVPVLPGYPLPCTSVAACPGDAFDWPSIGMDGYSRFADLAGITGLPAPVVDFTETNISGTALPVDTFQIFGN